MDRLQRVGAGAPARLDLAEGQRGPVEGDDVELAPARPVVALDDLKAAALQVCRCQLLADVAEAPARVAAHTQRTLWAGSSGVGAPPAPRHRIVTARNTSFACARVRWLRCSPVCRRSRSTVSILGRSGSRPTFAAACLRSRSSGSAMLRFASRATGFARRSSTPA